MGIVSKAQLWCRNWAIIDYPIDFANEINKMLDNFISFLNAFRIIFINYIPD